MEVFRQGYEEFAHIPPVEVKDISGCGLAGIINTDGSLVGGAKIADAIQIMHDRGNGLGAGFAAYGIYPEFKDFYALHLMYDDEKAREETEEILEKRVTIEQRGGIPTRHIGRKRPFFFVYFVKPRAQKSIVEAEEYGEEKKDEFIVRMCMKINRGVKGSFVISSGKNMGVFKGIGFPEEIANLFRIDEYEAFCWTAHNRFPTNTPGWWGGAHPFCLLDWTVVHNGEISSYGTNKRYLEMYGYKCTQLTDTEVIAYLLDLLARRHKLPLETVAACFAPPLWEEIENMDEDKKQFYRKLRMIYGSCMLNGPFSILVGFKGGLVGLNDRIKLRPLMVGKEEKTWYMASEEAAVKHICPNPDKIWAPKAGEPVIVRLEKDAYRELYGKSEERI